MRQLLLLLLLLLLNADVGVRVHNFSALLHHLVIVI